ncbi:zincin-like metallopeptidase domain-containing protein [Clostridium boliviensis]|uniref:Zincin-like metallopeptidase domain-containing protein n=1 Tax=Clostridium boliviensis TaxID=318465 RepID=A0ABU4GPR5_9CLOT|nr:zincin-like metallopeptidase domain-containing protein [Clostridium boliviensis]MDW2799583.1 zincin-like metallopeptidase domain-containing protein [Clostridium boliviensis]
MADKKKPYHVQVAERLIEQLEKGTAPWQKPWEPGDPNSMLPWNPITGKRYKGVNVIHLMAQGYSDPRWMTYKQAQSVGAYVRRGEKGTRIQYWKFTETRPVLDENGKPVLDENGKPVKEEVKLERPRVFYATVFNAQQIEGLPPLERKKKEIQWDPIERAERILQASEAKIYHGEIDRAFYRPSTDSIHLPAKDQFPTAAGYYATALHELGHWTGHPSRLNRDLNHPFGSPEYAKEELRAEIASMILGDELGIGYDPGQHAAYVKSWIEVLKNDPLEIFRAAAAAEKIQGYILDLEKEQKKETTFHQDQTVQRDQAVRVVGSEGDAYRLQVPDEIRNLTPGERIGCYVTDGKTLGYAPVRTDGQGNFFIKKEEIQWNRNPNIRLSYHNENGQKYLKMDGEMKGKAYIDKPKPLHELTWEMELKKERFQQKQQEITMERGLER